MKYFLIFMTVSVLNAGVFEDKIIKFFKATESAVNDTTRRVVETFDEPETYPDAFPEKLMREQREFAKKQKIARQKARKQKIAKEQARKKALAKKQARKRALAKLKKLKIKKERKERKRLTLAEQRSMEVKMMFGVPVMDIPKSKPKKPKRYVIIINDRTLKEEEKVKIKKHRRHIGNKPKNKYIIKIAKSYLNKPYKYGASPKTTRCFDCSSFVQRVYKTKKLPRTSKAQSYVGKHIAKSNIKTGDLVFFSSKKTKNIAHVGIALSKDKFIHASSGAGKVIISSLNKNYYRKHYKGARRIV
jgi:cell wall-associated NlpC family hydrolase